MIFLSPFLDVIKMLMLTVFSSHSYNVKFVACRILFFGLFIGLQLISTLYPWFLFSQLSYVLLFLSSSIPCNSIPFNACRALRVVNYTNKTH